MNGALANIIGAGTAAAVVAAGLFVGAPDVQANGPSNPMRLSAPPMAGHGINEIPVGDAIELWGQPTRLNLFWTTDRADEISRLYMDAWKSAGFDPQIRTIDKVTSVSATDAKTHLMRAVTIIDSGNERMVMPGLTDTTQPPDLSPSAAPVPIPENATGYLGNVADDTIAVNYSGTYMEPLTPERVVEFYRLEMGKLGYKEEIPQGTERVRDGATVNFSRGPEWVRITAVGPNAARMAAAKREGTFPKEAEGGKSSFVTVTHVRKIIADSGSKP